VFTAEDKAKTKLFIGPVFHGNLGALEQGTVGTFTALSVSRDGQAFTMNGASLRNPSEVFTVRLDFTDAKNSNRGLQRLSHANDKLLAGLDLPEPESVDIAVNGANMQMWILKPPGFDPAKKWPLVYLVHGGPQGAWEDTWHYRWNAGLWAAQGYVVALP